MPDLYVDAVRVACHDHPVHVPAVALPEDDDRRWLAGFVARVAGVPLEDLGVLDPLASGQGDESALCLRVLDALGPAAAPQPLVLVRSGPVLDPKVSMLAGLVHATDWAGDDLGLTHLDEQGGTAVLDLLAWTLPDDGGATVLVMDAPPVRLLAERGRRSSVVGLRLTRGSGALRYLDGGRGDRTPAPGAALEFRGTGPCDAWIALSEALAAGVVRAGDRLLLSTGSETSPETGWVLLEAAEPLGGVAVHGPAEGAVVR
ncbi:hypothetical protein [Streptomyces sp. NBC_00094]|uniref:hypothetical protein n=1 Tax=Streptomyces sp. NBC_00094 TaxID=2903620 RepID=UPI002259AAEE|nr:hypothetical protein [Streptomyces sp. NBC_00094]MCX5391929.1 hypothetical protein [Streptomyces sp. NBC_00094]